MGTRGKDLQEATATQLRVEMATLKPPMTKQDMAARIGVAHNSVGRYLSGQRDIPMGVMIDMAEALGLTADELLKRAYIRIGVDVDAPALEEDVDTAPLQEEDVKESQA